MQSREARATWGRWQAVVNNRAYGVGKDVGGTAVELTQARHYSGIQAQLCALRSALCALRSAHFIVLIGVHLRTLASLYSG